MTESKESKEDTIHKLSSFLWQRKLNERNSSPRGVHSESDQLWKFSAKPNSDLRCSDEIKKQARQNETLVFKTKNDVMPASKQSRNNFHYGNENNEKVLVAIKEASCDQKSERQLKIVNSFHGQNYRKDEKENVNYQKNINRINNSVNQISAQNHFKRSDRSQDFRNTKENENFIQKDRNFTHHQSWNHNQNNHGYHRDQERFNHQNEYHRNEAKNRNNYQNSPRNQNCLQNEAKIDQSQRKSEPFKRSISTNENSSSQAPSNVSKPGTRILQENSMPGIHYQRTFSPKTKNKNHNANVKNIQAEKFVGTENPIPQTGNSFGNRTPNVNNIYSPESGDLVSGEFSSFSNASNFSTDSFSNQFTAGISEPIPTYVYQNSSFRTNAQSNQSSDIPVSSFMNSYVPSNQAQISNSFNEGSSYSNEMAPNENSTKSDQRHFVNEFASNDEIPITFSSLSPDVADFIPKRNRIQTVNQVEYPDSLENLQPNIDFETRNLFSFSTPTNNLSQNTSWVSQNNSFISDCNESMISSSEDFQPYAGVSTTFNQKNSSEGLNNMSNQQPTAVHSVPEITNHIQTFNFNGRIVNLSDDNTQNNRTSTNESVQNFYPYEDTSVGNRINYDLDVNPGTNDCLENLNFNNQQISNILQIANLNLSQETASASMPSNQCLNDILQTSTLNVNENVVRQMNVPISSQTIVNDLSNPSVCRVLQNSRVNMMYDYYKNPLADTANHLKCDESEEMTSKLEMVAQQLFNVNKYVTVPEINAGSMTLGDSASDLNSQQFNFATFQRHKNEMEKYRQSGSFSSDNDNNSLLSSSNSMNLYENFGTSTSIAKCKSYDSFSTSTFTNSDFTSNEEQLFDIASRYNAVNLMSNDNNINNLMLSTQLIPNSTTSDKNVMSDFQNYERSNPRRNSADQYRRGSAAIETINFTQKYHTPLKNKNNNYGKRLFNNQVRITSNKPDNSMTINVRDDCFINFNRKNRQTESSHPKFNAIIGKPPSIGILKKTPKVISDTTIQFQKSPKDQNIDGMCPSSKENSLLNKRVSFLLENDQ